MLLGRYYSKISKKGRIALPSKFRKELGEKIILSRWYEGCLVVVGITQWNLLVNRFAKREEVFIKPIRSVERFILCSAYEIDIDNQGRFVIPESLRSVARLDNEIIFLGLGERVEIWDQKSWLMEENRVIDEADKMLMQLSKSRK